MSTKKRRGGNFSILREMGRAERLLQTFLSRSQGLSRANISRGRKPCKIQVDGEQCSESAAKILAQGDAGRRVALSARHSVGAVGGWLQAAGVPPTLRQPHLIFEPETARLSCASSCLRRQGERPRRRIAPGIGPTCGRRSHPRSRRGVTTIGHGSRRRRSCWWPTTISYG